MIDYEVYLKSQAPIQFSRYHDTEKLEKESNDAYDLRTWRNKAHVNEEDIVIIPAIFFKNALTECAQYLSIPIKGKGKATYTKNFKAGVLVLEPLVTGVKKEDLDYCDVFGSSQGKTGGPRVMKRFPIIRKWEGAVIYSVLDEIITKDMLAHVIAECGKFQGVGTWRPRNGGTNGRFVIDRIKEVK